MPATSIPIGATYEVPAVVDSLQFEEHSDVSPRPHILETTIKAFTLVDKAAPVVGRSWIEFVDDDLARAEFGRMSMMALYEGNPSWFPIDVDADAIEWVKRYLGLPPDIKTQCDIAIERLNLARRRLSIEDKTIDGAICLEALLGEGNKQEITYRLRLRAALLLSKDLNERREISKAVSDFYSLRSTAVHGDRSKLSDAQKNTCAAQGLDICARALRAIVSLEKKYIAEDWELSGGQ
jgi:hypothetical protein